MDLRPSARLAHYELISEVGAGGMGVVWKARDLRLQRIVALKVLRGLLASDPVLFAQFQREARTLALVQHPAIVTIYSVEQAGRIPFFTMEFVEGTPLSRYVPSAGLSLAEFYQCAIPLADAIGAAHAHGILHRDLKPGNVMVTPARGVKVLDFGLAAILPPESAAESVTVSDTWAGGVHGTPPFMSPEQVLGRKLDQRSDIFSFGAVLYFMLTGRDAFPGDTAGEVFASILRDSPPAVSAARPEASPVLDKLIVHCLQRDASRRPASMLEIQRALANARDEEPAAERLPRSIAVLPFDDLSAEKDQDYLCEGIAEEIILALTRIAGLRVASRSAAFLARATIPDRQALASSLAVETLLEGSVRKVGRRLRVTVELVDVATGYNLWTERYDGDMEDVFAIQEKIAGGVAEALRGTLTAREQHVIRDRPTPQLQAYDFYLRGRKYYWQYSRRGVEYALGLFQQAISIDPKYARAHAGLALCYAYRFLYAGAHPDDLAAADRTSVEALALNRDSADAHAARGFVLAVQHRPEAEQEFQEAMRLNPDLSDAYYFAARTAFAEGRFQTAIELWEKAASVRLDDYQSPLLVAQAYEQVGDAAGAERARRNGLRRAEEHLKLQPDDVRALYMGANGLVALGNLEKGLDWARQAQAAEPGDPMVLYNVGCIYALAGKADEALTCLEASVANGLKQRDWFTHDTNLDSLRSLPRFTRLMASLDGVPLKSSDR